MRKKKAALTTAKNRGQDVTKITSHLEKSKANRGDLQNSDLLLTDIVPQPVKKDCRDKLFPIVGIGASAGGLASFSQLLEHLPIDSGMAFVLIQHLSPNYKSVLTELLAKTTRLPVCQATNGLLVKPDHVYVMPSNVDMTITQGILRLKPRAKTNGRHLSIDSFFCSLAEDRKNSAVGIILSGEDSDGVLGLKAIKEEGGITFAQDAVSAKYINMPNNAVATGHVDFILSPAEIAKELVRLCSNSYLRESLLLEESQTHLDIGKKLKAIFDLLLVVTGTDFTNYKSDTIKRRIIRRLLINKVNNIDDYLQLLQQNQTELLALYQDILICVTSFFRDAEVFQSLKKNVFPTILNQKNTQTPIRIWVPGCSTGEEAYSIAICLLEVLKETIPIQIFASDINETNIYKARAGIYPESITDYVSPKRLQRYFNKVENGYQICKLVRDCCVFARHDLTRDTPFSRLDIISCRNMMIYLEPVFQNKIMSIFHYALNPNGVLILGKSETITSVASLFASIDKKNKIYIKVPAAFKLDYNFVSNRNTQNKTEKLYDHKRDNDKDISLNVGKEADRIILDRYAPAGVIVDSSMEIMQFRGHTGAYLEPATGEASLNLLKMARSDLRLPLQTLIYKVNKTKMAVKKSGLSIDYDGQLICINIEVIPISMPVPKRLYYLVLFENVKPIESKSVTRGENKLKIDNKPAFDDSQIKQLKQELAVTREYLQSIIDAEEDINNELRIASQEIQASNEELQSTNNELEMTKEELQSINEELITLNDELQNRNLELGQRNDDLSNLLSSVNIPIIMFSRTLCIRWFTPTAERVLNVRQSDIGHEITALSFNIDIGDLISTMLEVMNTFEIHEREIQDLYGNWYLLQLRPYQTLDNRIDGVLMVLLDIDAFKRNLELITAARNYAEAIVETMREPLLVLDANLSIKTANQTFYRFFQLTKAETVGQSIFQFDNGQWNIAELRASLSKTSSKQFDLQDILIEREFQRIGKKVLLLNIRQLFQLDNNERLLLLAIEDVTERSLKQEERARYLAQEKIYKEVFHAQEIERARIARELHDEFGQAVTAIMVEIELVISQGIVIGSKVGLHLDKIKQVVKHTALEIQRIAADLRPTVLDDFGLVAALHSLCDSFTESRGIAVEFNIGEALGSIPVELELVLYRVAQEALTNIAKHAQATHVAINFSRYPAIVELSVIDNGIGFDSNIILTKTGDSKIGLRGMRERLRIFGGILIVNSRPGHGCDLRAKIQLSMANEQKQDTNIVSG